MQELELKMQGSLCTRGGGHQGRSQDSEYGGGGGGGGGGGLTVRTKRAKNFRFGHAH